MLQSLRNVVAGWRQARTFRTLLEITAGAPHNIKTGIASAELSDKERLDAIITTDGFVEQYMHRANEFAFSVGAIMYDWLSPCYGHNRQEMLARIQYKTAHHTV